MIQIINAAHFFKPHITKCGVLQFKIHDGTTTQYMDILHDFHTGVKFTNDLVDNGRYTLDAPGLMDITIFFTNFRISKKASLKQVIEIKNDPFQYVLKCKYSNTPLVKAATALQAWSYKTRNNAEGVTGVFTILTSEYDKLKDLLPEV